MDSERFTRPALDAPHTERELDEAEKEAAKLFGRFTPVEPPSFDVPVELRPKAKKNK